MWSTSHHEYKFVDVSRFNIQQYIDILNLYSLFPSLEFHSLIMDRRDSNAGLGKWNNDAWEAYTHFARELLAERLTRDVFAIVDLQGKPNKSSVYLEDVLCSIGSVKGCLRATSDMSIYLQLVDLLLGCVQFDFKSQMGYFEPKSRRAQEKLQLVNFLKSKLGMRQGEAFLRKGQSFKRWDTPSVFTVWKPGMVRQKESAAITGVHPLSGTTLPGHSALTLLPYCNSNGLSTRMLHYQLITSPWRKGRYLLN